MNELLEKFYAHQKKIQLASTIWNVVANDQNNRMPPAAQSTRADQLAHINGHIHQLSNSPEYAQIVQELSKNTAELSRKDVRSLFLAGLNEVIQYHPPEFLEKFDTTKNKALAQRHKAKEQNDRTVLAPALAESFTMASEYARLYNAQLPPLSVWCDNAEYMMSMEKYDELFTPLAKACNEIISKSVKKEKDTTLFITEYDAETMLALLHELLGKIGFDFNQGVLSAIKRPYSENCGPGDERIHIGKGKGLLETILAGLHECGHGLTDMYINPDYHRTNLHRSVPMGVHESQARGLENMIGRSKPFCIYLATLLNKYFPSIRTRNADELYAYLNHIQPTLNRVTADEVSYNLHIIIRFQIEKEIFSGLLTVEDLPKRWNELYAQHLGVISTNDNEGPLQDQHRSLGLFGYFPTYALGNIISGQLRASFVGAHPTRADEIANGNFSSYFSRHKTNIRRHGNLDTTAEMLMRVTGSELKADFFVDYLTQKYLGVY